MNWFVIWQESFPEQMKFYLRIQPEYLEFKKPREKLI